MKEQIRQQRLQIKGEISELPEDQRVKCLEMIDKIKSLITYDSKDPNFMISAYAITYVGFEFQENVL